MKKLPYQLLVWIVILSACSSPNQLQSTPSVRVSPLPSMTITSTSKPTSIATASRQTDTAAPPSPTPTDTVTPSPTPPSAGVFAIKFYPPLVLDYPTEQWLDKSEYNNTQMMVNYLQNKDLKTCTIGPIGASGFYPENMDEITLGKIRYQVLLDQKTTDGNAVSYYFANIEVKGGIPHFSVQSSLTEAKKCRAAAEEVLATLRRSDQPKQSYCDLLEKRYRPPEGFITYCDPNYSFAFDYPAGWTTTLMAASPDTPGASPLSVRRTILFSAPDGSDFVRTDTYHRYASTNLAGQSDTLFPNAQSEYPGKDYPAFKIGGRRAYAHINRWVQDISAVYLFFQHDDYYTVMELKAPSPAALGLNWKIAASIQFPCASPQDNQIPPELISDSYILTGSK